MKTMGKNNISIFPLVVISYPIAICFLGVIWYIFFKDVNGDFIDKIKGGIKNIGMFTGQFVTISCIFIPIIPLLRYIVSLFKNAKLIAIAINLIIVISIIVFSIYFELNLFSDLINRIDYL